MHKHFSLLICFLCPLWSLAQFVPGAYILLANPQKVYTGDLKYEESKLIVRDKTGAKTKYQTDEVYYARTVDNRRYISASGFEGLSTFGTTMKGNTLVELVDSGQVCLMQYAHSSNSGSGGSVTLVTYLVKQAGMPNAIAIPGYVWTNQGKKFCEALAPYVLNRPDLQKLLFDHRINDRNLPAFFHALNSGQPFPALELRGREKPQKAPKERPVEDPFGN